MPQSQHSEAAELHNHAAHAHAVVECQHSTGDHAQAQNLTRRACECSQEAAQFSRKTAKHWLDAMEY